MSHPQTYSDTALVTRIRRLESWSLVALLVFVVTLAVAWYAYSFGALIAAVTALAVRGELERLARADLAEAQSRGLARLLARKADKA
jgi:hypothetical protein